MTYTLCNISEVQACVYGACQVTLCYTVCVKQAMRIASSEASQQSLELIDMTQDMTLASFALVETVS